MVRSGAVIGVCRAPRYGPVALALLLLAPVAAGAEFKDPAGDVVFDAYDQASAPADDPAVDILRVWVGNETRNTIELGFETAAPEPTDDVGLFGWRFSFLVDGAQYELDADSCGDGDAALRRYENNILDDWHCIPYERDGNVRVATIEKADIRGLDRKPVGLGSTIAEFQLEAFRNAAFPANRWLDRGPDHVVPEALVMEVVGAALGDVQWRIDEPIHLSNGVLGLFSTTMHMINGGNQTAEVVFTGDPPAGWSSLVPESIKVDAGQAISVPIAFIPPGAHSHGDATTWTVTASLGDEVAEHKIGLDFFDVPQPAGHHPRIWLHGADIPGPGLSGATVEDIWMNALEDDPSAETVRIHHNGQTNVIGAMWEALLRPELLQNIALIPGNGTATVRAYAEQPVAQGTATMDIVYCDPSISSRAQPIHFYNCPQGDSVLLTRGSTSFEPQTGGPFELEFDLPIDEASTIITTANDALGMGLNIELAGAWAPGDLSQITIESPGSYFDLPLIDRAQARNHAESLGIEVEDWTPSRCPPDGGAHVVELTNARDAGKLRWTGISSLGSRLALPEPTTFDSGATRSFEIPVGAEDGVNENFGAILASLDGNAFAWLTWLHVGACPLGDHERGALADRAQSGRSVPSSLPSYLVPLALLALLRRRP